MRRILDIHSAALPIGVVVFVACAYAGLRLVGLGAPSVWWDEAFTWFAALSPRAVVATLGEDVHPPGYFLFMSGWQAAFGGSPLALRLPSVLFSVGTLLVGMRLASRVDGALAALVFALLLACLPYELHLARFARHYTLLMFLGSLFALLVYRFALDGERRALWLALPVGVASLYVHYLAALGVGAVLSAAAVVGRAWAPARRRSQLAPLVFLAGGLGVAFLPWLPRMLAQLETKERMPHFHTVFEANASTWLLPLDPVPVGHVFSGLPAGGAWGLLGAASAVALLLLTLGRARALAARPLARAFGWQIAITLAALALSPTPLVNDRNLSLIAVPALVLVAAAQASLLRGRGVGRGLAAAALAAYVTLSVIGMPHANHNPDWRAALAAAADLAAGLPPGATVLATGRSFDDVTLAYHHAQGRVASDLAGVPAPGPGEDAARYARRVVLARKTPAHRRCRRAALAYTERMGRGRELPLLALCGARGEPRLQELDGIVLVALPLGAAVP